MKTQVPAHEVEVCDICYCAGLLETCKACGCRYCLMCDALVAGCIHSMDVCKNCGESAVVQEIARKYAPQILAVLKKRDSELRKAKK